MIKYIKYSFLPQCRNSGREWRWKWKTQFLPLATNLDATVAVPNLRPLGRNLNLCEQFKVPRYVSESRLIRKLQIRWLEVRSCRLRWLSPPMWPAQDEKYVAHLKSFTGSHGWQTNALWREVTYTTTISMWCQQAPKKKGRIFEKRNQNQIYSKKAEKKKTFSALLNHF